MDARISKSLNGFWRIKPETGNENTESWKLTKFDDKDWDSISVPDYWNSGPWWMEAGGIPEEIQKNGWHKEVRTALYPDFNGIAWYRNKFSVNCPENKKVFIEFSAVSAKAEVWINGSKAGEHTGAFSSFKFDITALVNFNGENLLAVRVTSKKSMFKTGSKNDSPGFLGNSYERESISNATFPLGGNLNSGGIWQDVTLYICNNLYVDNIFVQTSTSSLKLELEIGNASGQKKNLTVRTQIEKADDREILFQKDEEVKLDAGIKNPAAFSFEELHPLLWTPETPNLYRLRIELFDKNELLDVFETSIGFRSIETVDHLICFNGHPYFLRGTNTPPHGLVRNDREWIYDYIKRLKGINCAIIRFHTEPPTAAWLDACDELGMMVILEGPLFGSMGAYSFDNETFRANAFREWEEIVRKYRNRPSIIIWSVSNELFCALPDAKRWEAALKFLKPLVKMTKKLDPSRPVIGSSGETCEAPVNTVEELDDIQDMHFYCGWYTEPLYHLRYLTHTLWKDSGPNRPWIVSECVTAYTNPDTGAFYDCPRQHKTAVKSIGISPEPIKDALEYQARVLKEMGEWLRRLRQPDTRVAGFVPFGHTSWYFNAFDPEKCRPKPVANVAKTVLAPVLISIECWNRNVFAGTMFTGKVFVINDAIDRKTLQNLTVCAALLDPAGNSVMKSEQKISDVPYYCSAPSDLTFKVPEKLEKGIYTLFCRLESAGKTIAENTMRLNIAPKSWATTKSGKMEKNLYLYDISGMTKKALDFAGIKYGEIKDISLPEKNGALIVGSRSMDSKFREKARYLENWMQDGGNLLVLDQNPRDWPENFLDGKVKLRRDYFVSWYEWCHNLNRHSDAAWSAVPGHPAFNGISHSELRWWNNDTFLASYYYDLDKSDQFKALAFCGKGIDGTPQSWDTETLPVMVERSFSKGKCLLSQLESVRRADNDPIALRCLVNMINYISSSGNN